MIQNYSEHKPQMLIYNNREVVSDGTADRNSACLVGVCRPSFTTKNFLSQMVPVTELTVAELGEEEEVMVATDERLRITYTSIL